LEIDDPVVKNSLVELDESGRGKAGAELDPRLHDVLTGFERRHREHTVRGRAAALKQGQVPKEDELAVLLELEQLERARQQEQDTRARQGISDLTDG
jgi:molybdenum-dependent DNA-binding transcriptional regulator ModE